MHSLVPHHILANLARDDLPPSAFSLQPSSFHAFAAAWHIKQHVKAHAWHHTPYGAFHFSARVGLSAGDVVWGILLSADESQATYNYRRSAINTCIRAEHLANLGDLVLSPAMAATVKGDVTGEEIGESYFRVTAVTVPLPPPRSINLPSAHPGELARFFPHDLIMQSHPGEFRSESL